MFVLAVEHWLLHDSRSYAAIQTYTCAILVDVTQ
jgi:hypothetical protein